MTYGRFSFGVAKADDIVWDVCIGRGGQALLAIVTYQVFTKSLTRTMEETPVSHDTFKAITLQNDTIAGLYLLTKDFLRTSGGRARVAMFWTILASVFVLALPTWLSAMTGYTPDIQPFVNDTIGNLIPAGEFRPSVYTIHDGHRLGPSYTRDYRVTVPWQGSDRYYSNYRNYYECYTYYDQDFWTSLLTDDCRMLWWVSEYAARYGLLGRNNTMTEFFLPSSHPEHQCKSLYRNGTDTTYDLDEYNFWGSCQQGSPIKYKWGFSFLLLYVFVGTWFVWSIGMYCLYLDSYAKSRLDISKRDMGIERAVLDLTRSIQSTIDVEKVDTSGNSALRRLVRKTNLSYEYLLLNTVVTSRWEQLRIWWQGFSVKKWLHEEKYWLCAMLGFDLLFALSFTVPVITLYWSPTCSFMPGFGVLWVLLIGKKRLRARWIYFGYWFVLFWICNIVWIVSYSF
ncbi:hypothetical protein LTR05_008260 [Lithohypha guttulata]|uniref:Uncharacterized protein n=1 Tax=Lithohypha guttulata TaxID=1690604 RepID=A0AAN7STC2_9EURO|nr:hypothetical protein LTR05_008260 [Lithohypha guttulata]